MSTTPDQNGAPVPALAEEISGPIPQPILAQLACPVCHGSLAAGSAELICASCGRRYPIVQGIPVLIAGREQETGNGEKGIENGEQRKTPQVKPE